MVNLKKNLHKIIVWPRSIIEVYRFNNIEVFVTYLLYDYEQTIKTIFLLAPRIFLTKPPIIEQAGGRLTNMQK